MIAYIKFVFEAAVNTIKGLFVTLKIMLLPSITVQYPTEKLAPYPAFRGMLVYDPEKCIACGMCERACPSKCISFAVQKDAEGKSLRKIDWYLIDYGRCNFCGLCEEACPTKPKAVWHSLDYEAVFHSRDEMVRYWKSGDHFYGNIYNFELKAFEPVRGQLHLEGVPEHRRV